MFDFRAKIFVGILIIAFFFQQLKRWIIRIGGCEKHRFFMIFLYQTKIVFNQKQQMKNDSRFSP